jgi:hypothetical protein
VNEEGLRIAAQKPPVYRESQKTGAVLSTVKEKGATQIA